MASFLSNLCTFCTISVQVFFDLPLGLALSTSYSIHFFTHHCLLFAACNHTNATCFAVVLRLYRLILVFQLFTWNSIFLLNAHIHLTILISAHWSATLHFLFLWARSHFHATYYFAYNLPLTISDISLLVSSGIQAIQILASTPASASPCTLTVSPK